MYNMDAVVSASVSAADTLDHCDYQQQQLHVNGCHSFAGVVYTRRYKERWTNERMNWWTNADDELVRVLRLTSCHMSTDSIVWSWALSIGPTCSFRSRNLLPVPYFPVIQAWSITNGSRRNSWRQLGSRRNNLRQMVNGENSWWQFFHGKIIDDNIIVIIIGLRRNNWRQMVHCYQHCKVNI